MLVEFISISSILFPLLAGFSSRYFNDKRLDYFLGFIIFSFVFEIISTSLLMNGINNHGMFKLFVICDFLFFIWFFSKQTTYSIWIRHLSMVVLLLIGFESFNSLLWHKAMYAEGIFFIIIFLFFIIQSMQVLLSLINEHNLLQNPVFWIATARLFYYLIVFSVFVYLYLEVNSFNDSLFAMAFVIINASGNILCNIMFGMSFLCRKNRN